MGVELPKLSLITLFYCRKYALHSLGVAREDHTCIVEGEKKKKREKRQVEWMSWVDTWTNNMWRKSSSSRWSRLSMCTRGRIEVEGHVGFSFYKVLKARWGHSLLLPVVKDGCVALVVQLHVTGENLISLGLKEKWGTDSYFSLIIWWRNISLKHYKSSKTALRDCLCACWKTLVLLNFRS